MKVTVLAVGRIRSPFDEAESHYMKMLRTKQSVDVVEVKDDAALVRRLDPESYVVALELGGKQLDSDQWARWLDRRRHAGRKVTMLIGGPEGLPPEVQANVDESLSLGKQTMAHQLARIALLEQIFRASKILAGEKYHL